MKHRLILLHAWMKTGTATILVVLSVLGRSVPAHAETTVEVDGGSVATSSSGGQPNGKEDKNDRILSPVPGIALLGTGGALLLTSIITGSVALSLNSDLRDNCPGGGCYAPYHDDVDRLDALAAVTDAFIPLGTVMLIAGAFTLIASKQTERKYGEKGKTASRALDRLHVTASGVTWRF